MATLGIQRFVVSGANVAFWNRLGVVANGLRTSYQRTCDAIGPAPSVSTDCDTVRLSAPDRLRYAKRYINLSARVSRVLAVPGCGIQLPAAPLHATVVGDTPRSMKVPVAPPKPLFKVEFAGVKKSTWNFIY